MINERKLPLDFSANDVSASMSYDARPHSYLGRIQIGKIDLKYQDFREVPANADFEFTLWENALQVQSLKLTSQGSALQASGKLTNFSQPEVQLTYDATLDVAQLGAIVRASELQGGAMQLNGIANYSQSASYSTRGHIAFRNLDYRHAELAAIFFFF